VLDRGVRARRVSAKRFWLSQSFSERSIRLGLGGVKNAKHRPATVKSGCLLNDPSVASDAPLALSEARHHRVHVLRSLKAERRDDAAQPDSLIIAGETLRDLVTILGWAEVGIEDCFAVQFEISTRTAQPVLFPHNLGVGHRAPDHREAYLRVVQSFGDLEYESIDIRSEANA
jgi:hypothetical protein